MEHATGIQRAVDLHEGSPSKLASAVGGGVLRQHVEHWLKIGRVSAEKCPDVSSVTGIPCEELNNKVNWALVRVTPAHIAPTAIKPIATKPKTPTLAPASLQPRMAPRRHDEKPSPYAHTDIDRRGADGLTEHERRAKAQAATQTVAPA